VSGPVIVLAGGTGGAKLARGMLDVAGDELVVIANTADDVEVYGAYVSPDPDLVTFWLADAIDARGWGIEGDTFAVMDGLRALGEDVWFALGDRDLALGLWRAQRLAAGERLTTVCVDAARAYGVPARVLPMCDEPVRTWVDGVPFQEWMIRAGGKAGSLAPSSVELRGTGRPTPETLEAIAAARAIVIGPSNPVISIGPILSVLGDAIAAATAAVVAVSPFVGGQIVKGPSDPMMRAAGIEPSPAGVAAHYAGLIDGFVADEQVDGLPTLVTDVLMDSAGARARVAREVLTFAESLS
jgi:LPPG:FO 2-phospho-L-lactate transferase